MVLYSLYVVTCIDLDWQAATCATPNSAKDLICLSPQCRAIIRSHSGSDYAYSREAKVSAAWEKGGRVNFGDKFNGGRATLDTVRRYTPVEMGKPITQADRGLVGDDVSRRDHGRPLRSCADAVTPAGQTIASSSRREWLTLPISTEALCDDDYAPRGPVLVAPTCLQFAVGLLLTASARWMSTQYRFYFLVIYIVFLQPFPPVVQVSDSHRPVKLRESMTHNHTSVNACLYSAWAQCIYIIIIYFLESDQSTAYSCRWIGGLDSTRWCYNL